MQSTHSLGTAALWQLTIPLGMLCVCETTHAQLTAYSLPSLRAYSSAYDNTHITLAPGEYWIDGDHITDPSADPTFLELTGSGNTFEFAGATIRVDTRELAGFGGSGANNEEDVVEVVKITGSNNTVRNLTLIGEDVALDTDPDAQRWADLGTNYVQLSGVGNTVDGAHITSRGSSPYGLGDAFGKGGSSFPQGEPPGQVAGAEPGVVGLPWITPRKTSAFQVRDSVDGVINDLHLNVRSFGHGFYVQKASNTTLTNSTVTGELVPATNVIDHEKYQAYGLTTFGTEIPEDIYISTGEDGVRLYGVIDGVPVEDFYVDNVVVSNMRSGFATSVGHGDKILNNVESYGNEVGFTPSTGEQITNAKGDIVNGPLVYFQYNNARDTSIDVELVGDGPVGEDWAVAYLNGQRIDINLTSDIPADELPADSLVRYGQTFFNDWRNTDLPTGPDDGEPGDYIESEFHNNTNQIMVFGDEVTGNVGSSQAPVVSNGKENYYDGVTVVLSGSRLNVTHAKGLGNNGSETGAALDGNRDLVYTGTATEETFTDNGTVVYDGATLEIQPLVQIKDERVTITGDGVDGKGAIYSDGSNNNLTRLVNDGTGSEELIILDGDASIGVGDANGQLLVTRLSGAGDFTKLGDGTLSVERYSTFDGDFIVAAGTVIGRTSTVTTDLILYPGATISAIGGNMVNAPGSHAVIDGTFNLNSRDDDNTLSHRIGSVSGAGVITSTNPYAGAGGELQIVGESGQAVFAGEVDEAVSLVKSGNATQVLAPADGSLDYSGTTTVDGGRLLIAGNHLFGGDYQVNDGGTLGGQGLFLSDLTVASGGRLAPGFPLGIMTYRNIEMQSGSSLEIEIGSSSEHDSLAALNDLLLAGDLEISLLASESEVELPATGDSFVIATAASLRGSFANVTSGSRIATIGGEGTFLIIYSSATDEVVLSNFIPANFLAGDFNHDGVVDAADYTVWRDSLDQTGIAPYTSGDANGDGAVTSADYQEWKNNFGVSTSNNQKHNVPVPEPYVLSLLIACVVSYSLPNSRRIST